MAKSRIETDIDINAPASQVWALLTDFARMPSGIRLSNPFLAIWCKVLGSPFTSHRGLVRNAFKPTVLSVRPERELRWLGHLLVPGIFDGEHYFLLKSIGENRTRLTQGEKFSGLLSVSWAAR